MDHLLATLDLFIYFPYTITNNKFGASHCGICTHCPQGGNVFCSLLAADSKAFPYGHFAAAYTIYALQVCYIWKDIQAMMYNEYIFKAKPWQCLFFFK